MICSPLILSLSFSSFATSNDDLANLNVSLPFPHPSEFGPYYSAIVFSRYNSSKKKNTYEMWVLTFEPEYGDNISNMNWNFFVENNKNAFSIVGTAPVGLFSLYNLWYHDGDLSYSISTKKSQFIEQGSGLNFLYNPSNFDGSSNAETFRANSLSLYGAVTPYYSSDFTKSRSGAYVFQGSVNPSMISEINQNLLIVRNYQNGIHSDTALIKSGVNTISLYTQDILKLLKDNYNFNDFTTAENTTNSDMNNFESAENKMLDDNFNKVSDVSLADVSSFKTGSVGNAFAFISSNIEFFSGNGVGANSSMNKIGAVVMVVLGLGLASFVVGLVNRRKE